MPYGDPNLVPGYTGMAPAGYPPNAQAWPGVDIYRPGVNQHYVKDGFWFNRVINGQSHYFMTVEGLITQSGAPPHSLIGAQGVNQVSPEAAAVLGTTSGTTSTTTSGLHNQQFVERAVNPANFEPDRSTSGTGSSSGGGGGNGTTTSVDPPIFITQNAGVLPQNIGAGGVRANWGWWNPDGSGFMAQGFWQAAATGDFVLGYLPAQWQSSLYIDTLNPANVNNNFLTHLQPWFGLPLPPASPIGSPNYDRDQDGLAGVVVPYDMYVQFTFRSQTFGGNLDWYFSPIVDGDYFKIRPVAGARYLKVNEAFSFSGADSGMGYELTQSTTTSNSGSSNGNSNNQQPGSYQLQIDTLDGTFAFPDPFQSYLLSQTQSQFAGPEVGLRFDVGGKRTKLWFQSKFGLLANYNTRKVSGYGIGDHYDVLLTDPDVNGDGIPDNPLAPPAGWAPPSATRRRRRRCPRCSSRASSSRRRC